MRKSGWLRKEGNTQILVWAELGLTVAACAVAFLCPRVGEGWFRAVEQGFAGLARRRRLAVLVVGVVAIAARIAVLPILPVPQPNIADEYSFLLAAQTFAHGRLTNPTPPMWQHLETLHVLEKPSYMSMYPPAQGLFLAAGLVTAGTAFAGVLLSVGLMCAAICWMLQGWFPPGWALLGGLLAVLRFDIFNYWANSYWGGAVAAFGGALLLGALPRLLKRERVRDAAWMGVGLAILANSRPYEGLIFSLPVAAVLLVWLWKKRGASLENALRRVVLPLTLVLAIAGAGMGFYFWRVTGSPFEMPQELARRTHAVAPYFLWQSPRPVPVYRIEALRNFYLHHEMSFYRESRTPLGLAGVELGRCLDFWFFFLGPALTLPLLLAPAAMPHGQPWGGLGPPARFLVVAAAVFMAGLAVEVFFFPHYAAPATGLVLALVIGAMRRLRAWEWHGRPTGRFVTRAVPLVCLLMVAIRVAAVPLHISITPRWPPTSYNSLPAHSSWVKVNRQLESYPGKQLVIVQYSQKAKCRSCFVYNGPDPPQAKVVWAWNMGPAENEKLIQCYKNRRVWLLDVFEQPAVLIPYTPAASLRGQSEIPPAARQKLRPKLEPRGGRPLK
jgi:hypothetical protein